MAKKPSTPTETNAPVIKPVSTIEARRIARIAANKKVEK